MFLGGVAIGGVLRYQKTPNENNKKNDITNTEPIIISPEKPAGFEGVEMMTYKSPTGYEITYPKGWSTVLAPKESSNDLENYALYPKDISYGPSPIFTIIVLESSVGDYFRHRSSSIEDLKKVLLNGSSGYKHLLMSPSGVTIYVFPLKENLVRIECSNAERILKEERGVSRGILFFPVCVV